MKRVSIGVAALVTLAALAGCSSAESETAPVGSPSSPEGPSQGDAPTDSVDVVDSTDEDPGSPETPETPESPEGTESPASPAVPVEGSSAGDYQAAYVSVGDLLQFLDATQRDAAPTSTEEANRFAALDETTDLMFGDYTVLPKDPETGAFCLESAPTGVFVTMVYSGPTSQVSLGEGECSYDDADATVLGALDGDVWTQGGDLMGALTPQSVFVS